MEYITLNNSVQMPILGFDVFQVEDAAVCEQSVAEAIEVDMDLYLLHMPFGDVFSTWRAMEEMTQIATCDAEHLVIGDFDDPEFAHDLCNRKYNI